MSRLTDSTTRLDGAGFKVDSWIVVDDDEGDDDDDDDGGSDGGCDDDDDDPKVWKKIDAIKLFFYQINVI